MDHTKGLVVEDNEEHAAIFVEAFEAQAVAVRRCSSEAEAIALVQREFFHAAIVDLSLVPGTGSDRGGLSVLRELARLGEGTACILATAYGDYEKAREATVLYGAVELLSKGANLTPAVLREAIGKAVGVGIDRYRAAQPAGVEVLRGLEPEDLWMDRLLRGLAPQKGARTLIDMMNKLLEGLTPVLEHRGAGGLDEARRVFEKKLWSKMVGCGVVVEVRQRPAGEVDGSAPRAVGGELVRGPLRGMNLIGIVRRSEEDFGQYEFA